MNSIRLVEITSQSWSSGKGRRDDPFRYRLPEPADEYWDRGELPPLDLVLND